MSVRRGRTTSASGSKEEETLVDPFDGAIESVHQTRHEIDGPPDRGVVAAELCGDPSPGPKRFADRFEVVETVHCEMLAGRLVIGGRGHGRDPRGRPSAQRGMP